MQTLQETIVNTARSYVGQKEKPGNRGWNDPTFQKKMEIVGWQNGFAWCSFLAELIYRTAAAAVARYDVEQTAKTLFSGSATQTWSNFKDAVGWERDSKPKPGDIVIYQWGSGWQGHAGIVTEIGKNGYFFTVEGNTSMVSEREGDGVATKKRLLGEKHKPKGLNILGFIRPKASIV